MFAVYSSKSFPFSRRQYRNLSMLLLKITVLYNISVLLVKHQTHWTGNIYNWNNAKSDRIEKKSSCEVSKFLRCKSYFSRNIFVDKLCSELKVWQNRKRKVHLFAQTGPHWSTPQTTNKMSNKMLHLFCLLPQNFTSVLPVTSFDFMYRNKQQNLIRGYGLC